MSGLLHDRSVVVTGAASGIGSATTRLLLGEGAKVLATDIDEKRGEILVRELDSSFPKRVRFLQHDVTQEDAWIRNRRSGGLTCSSTTPACCLPSLVLLRPASMNGDASCR